MVKKYWSTNLTKPLVGLLEISTDVVMGPPNRNQLIHVCSGEIRIDQPYLSFLIEILTKWLIGIWSLTRHLHTLYFISPVLGWLSIITKIYSSQCLYVCMDAFFEHDVRPYLAGKVNEIWMVEEQAKFTAEFVFSHTSLKRHTLPMYMQLSTFQHFLNDTAAYHWI